MRSAPFPPPYMMLGPQGDLWVPMNGFFPHSRHLAVLERIDAYMNSQADLIERHHIVWGQVSALEGLSRVMVEVSLYWEDARTQMMEGYLDHAFLRSKMSFPPNPGARAAVHTLRMGLINLFREMGAVHIQIGRVYPYLDSRLPVTADLVRALKRELDPQGRMNPGALGLS